MPRPTFKGFGALELETGEQRERREQRERAAAHDDITTTKKELEEEKQKRKETDGLIDELLNAFREVLAARDQKVAEVQILKAEIVRLQNEKTALAGMRQRHLRLIDNLRARLRIVFDKNIEFRRLHDEQLWTGPADHSYLIGILLTPIN